MVKEIISYKEGVLAVRFKPNFIEKFFGLKEYITEFAWENEYEWDNAKVWFSLFSGKKIGRVEMFDNYLRKTFCNNVK